MVLQALESGAVDYIKKPEMSEMVEKAPVIRERLKVAAQANLSRRQGLIAKKAHSQFVPQHGIFFIDTQGSFLTDEVFH